VPDQDGPLRQVLIWAWPVWAEQRRAARAEFQGPGDIEVQPVTDPHRLAELAPDDDGPDQVDPLVGLTEAERRRQRRPLDHVIDTGGGTGGARADLEVSPHAMREVAHATAADVTFNRAWDTVQQAIVGFEYPEGMELLATVHYLATRPGGTTDVDAMATQIADWNERKRHLFGRADVNMALEDH
jgi:hypothetical protein